VSPFVSRLQLHLIASPILPEWRMIMDEEALEADPDIVAAWVAGWALSRGAPPPVRAFGGFRVEVGLPDQKARIVFPAASPRVRLAADATPETNILLKVCARPELVRSHLPADWQIKPLSFMMTTDELVGAPYGLGEGYRVRREQESGGSSVQIFAADGELAASGRVFFVASDAIYDRIETHPAHRRRGLGQVVMRELGCLALDHGACRGLLVATPDGRALYNRLGWRLHALYTTAARRAADPG